MPLKLLYISISGNTRAFIDKLTTFADEQGQLSFDPIEVSDASPDIITNSPFFAFVPTYLDGGNGIGNGIIEIMTDALHEQLEIPENTKNLIGIIGSGNKNFNAQYILTARRYAVDFNAPLIANYELRGTQIDVERVYQAINQRFYEYNH
ncbi:class Ib ribonucleoside-diphosphate reductase assembly flavoprotein NrdI [Weissella sagaensis]|jgi:protein involved in ribonucleotide reduction|uniref:class Ib ribonucleoside-diphosphate reductase assembly flavoprotein NrdI n=1 Tax=Weissella sagaensis TaxID=2559928 RepID=UPI0009DE2A20|nr:class Ib ribonucleoside-diphosphate reductase assembly flavoprotein NrdI [Weissella sagaensis]QDJ59199.1 class Ib ribonucleoside-diphosphate reductase assembly flavoprotein NrdI [Weissella hellenica]QEA56492.1 class Ib ribonucleoside-diphosphate reductase assembly flavoprotein NrdI [Weissella hellenica]UEG67315.1 class Ib ribonucleoside-diphosphate reductase assembly flavoprotein NrdI [Weissella hellenica]